MIHELKKALYPYDMWLKYVTDRYEREKEPKSVIPPSNYWTRRHTSDCSCEGCVAKYGLTGYEKRLDAWVRG